MRCIVMPRRSNAERIIATSSRPPATAARAARCATFDTFEVAWLWKLVGGLDHVVRADHPADPPARHRVGLGDAVEDDALLARGRARAWRIERELVRAVGQVLVDLVGDHPHAALDGPLADRLGLGRRVHRAGRVVGADEQDRLGAVGVRRFELVDGDLEVGLVVGVDHHRRAVGERDRLGVGGPVRRRADHLVARVAEHGERREHGVLAAVGDEHLPALAGRTRSHASSWRRSRPSARAGRRPVCTRGSSGRGTPRPRPRRCARGSGSRARPHRTRSRSRPSPSAPWPWRRRPGWRTGRWRQGVARLVSRGHIVPGNGGFPATGKRNISRPRVARPGPADIRAT